MIKDLKLSRRSFIKALGALGLVATLPPVALHEKPAQLPVAEVIDDAVIDLPISKETPFAWIKLNGEKIAILRIDVAIENRFSDSDDVQPWSACEVSFDAIDCYPLLQSHMCGNEIINFEIGVPGYNHLFAGNGRIIDMAHNIGDYSYHAGGRSQEIFTSVKMKSVSPLSVYF